VSTLAAFVLRRPRAITAAWVVSLLAGLGLGARLNTRLQDGGYTVAGSESQRAAALSEKHFGATPQAYLSTGMRRALIACLSQCSIRSSARLVPEMRLSARDGHASGEHAAKGR
jgi:hypothetical protein